MKIMLCGLLLAGLACGCATTATTVSLPQAILMKIVCRDEPSLKQDIISQLRVGMGKGVIIDHVNGELYIQVNFLLDEVPLYKVQDLQTDLRSMSGMITVDLEWNRSGMNTPTSVYGHLPDRDGTQLIH